MSETECSSKKNRMVCDSYRDRLSELPSSIMEIILSSISTREAVRMSILSKQYRYTWTGLPHLQFNFSEFNSVEVMDKFVTNVLKLHKGPIHKFAVLLKQSLAIVRKWVPSLPANEIRELILKLDSARTAYSTQPCSIVYSFNKLTHLELHRCDLGWSPPLTFRGFVFLRCLILVYVIISFNAIESIVANSPLIETLILDNIRSDIGKPELRISAPNLKCFDIETYASECMQIYLSAPILAEMRVNVFGCAHILLIENRSTYNYTNFFGGCNSIQKLRGNFFNKVMSYGVDSCQYSFVLPHLKVIELDDVNSVELKEMSLLVNLMAGAPNLEKLDLMLQLIDEEEELEAPDLSYMDFLPTIEWEKLRIITIRSLTGVPSEIKFLHLLLENSPALEDLILDSGGLYQWNEDLKDEIMKCNYASPDCNTCFK